MKYKKIYIAFNSIDANLMRSTLSSENILTLTPNAFHSLKNTDNNIRVNAVLPSIIDTKANRDAMPNEDFSVWQTPLHIAKTIELTIDSNESGVLVSVDN